MTKKRQKFDLGIRSKPTDETLDAEGEISVSITNPKLKVRVEGQTRDVVTEDQTQELTNKTIDATDATGTNTVTLDAHDATYDDMLTTANPVGGTLLKSLGGDVQSALDAVKIALDDQNDADEITYDPTLNPETTANNVQAALDDTGIASAAAQQTADNHIANSTGAHAASAIANTPSGNLAATDVQGALDELQDEMDDARQDLVDHELQATGAHAASAISHTAIVDLDSNNVQDALAELQLDINTRATGSSLTAHTGAATGAHAASAISVTPAGNLSSTEVQAALEELQNDIDGAVNSSQLTTHTTATSAHGTTSAIVGVDDVQTLTNKTMESALEYSSTTKSASKADIQPDPTTSGSDATLFYTNILASHLPIMRLENGSLVSVAMLANPEQGKEVTIINATGNDITIRNDVGATAANRILTGTKADIVLKDEASIVVKYDSYENAAEGRWMVIGGVGAEGGGDTDVDVMFVENFERSTIADYTVTGAATITESAAEVINGTKSLKLDHTAAVSAKRTIAVPNKFRGIPVVMEFDVNSNATSGNITGTIVDESNVVTLVNAESIEPYNGTGSQKRQVYFQIPETCASLSYQVDGLLEASAITIIDDIQIEKVFQTSTTTTTDELLKENEFSARIANPSGVASITSQSSPFIQSVNRSTLGVIDVVFVAGFFTVTPSLIATCENATAADEDRYVMVQNLSTSGCTLRVENAAANSLDESVNIIVQRQGSDYDANLIRRVETKDTFSEIVVLEDRDISEINEFSATCLPNSVLSSNAPFIQSVNNPSLGIYDITYISGLFSVEPSVTYAPHIGGTELRIDSSSSTAVRLHFYNSAGGSFNVDKFSIKVSRQGSDVYNKTLKRIKTNPNQKIKIPSSEMRLEGSSGKGTGSETFVVNFDSLTKSIGSDLLLDNSNGTKITCKKDGLLKIAASLVGSASSKYVTKNQAVRTTYPVESEIMIAASSPSAYAGNLSGTFSVKAGDVIRVVADGTISSNIANHIELYFQEQEIQVGVSNILPKFSESDACISLYGYGGYGSLDSKILAFNVEDINSSNGSLTYTTTSANGTVIEILENGLYDVSFYMSGLSTQQTCGITLNASSTTSLPASLPDSEVLVLEAVSGVNANYGASGSTQRLLNKGDKLRVNTNGTVIDQCRFTISKVGKPNITSVDVTPFVDLEVFASSDWVNGGPVVIDATTTAPNKGTDIVTDNVWWRRVGSDAEIRIEFRKNGNTGASSGVGDYLFKMPSGLKIDTTKLTAYSTVEGSGTWLNDNEVGTFNVFAIGQVNGPVSVYDEDSVRFMGSSDTSVGVIGGAYGNISNTVNQHYVATFRVPIQGWTKTNPEIVTQDQSNASDFNIPETITIEYTGGGGSKGTVVTDEAKYQRHGQNGKFSYAFYQSAVGTNGTGDILFTLPNNLQFDSSIPLYTGNLLYANGDWANYMLESNCFFMTTSDGGHGYVIPYDSTRFRVMGYSDSLNNYGAISDDYFHLGVTRSFSINFEAPIAGWSSESKYLVNVPVNKTAYIKDVKPSGTLGGAASGGYTANYKARDLNTLEGDTGFISLDSVNSRFRLQAGVYDLEADQPVRRVNNFQSRLYNFTDSIVHTLGSSGYATGTTQDESRTKIYARIDISEPKEFEIQLRTAGSTDSNDLGVANGFGDNEVYTQVKITKVR